MSFGLFVTVPIQFGTVFLFPSLSAREEGEETEGRHSYHEADSDRAENEGAAEIHCDVVDILDVVHDYIIRLLCFTCGQGSSDQCR